MKYDPKALEAKWQARWESAELYKTPSSPKREYYVLEMFAYPVLATSTWGISETTVSVTRLRVIA
jgi:hypothetical protein